MKHNFIIKKIRHISSAALLVGACCSVAMANRPESIGVIGQTRMEEPKKDRTITGTVTSKTDGSAMPGVNVVIKGTQIGTSTDASGKYSIEVNDEKKITLVFSYIGYDSQEITVANQSVINLAISENVATLDEAVVTALGIKRETKSLSYNVGKVDGKDMVNVAQENVVNSLAGRVAGVTLNQTSGVGSSVSVVIRGAKSLSNDNQPLFVIDGVPMVNNLNNVKQRGDRNNVDYGNVISDINPEDVESVSILKGPSAAALYGSRAGNGVILITTKSGKKGKGLGVTFSSSNVFETPYRFLDLHYKYANGSRINRLDQSSAYWGGPQLDAGNTAVQWNSPLDANGNPIPTELRSYKDNMKNFLETGITSTNNVSISGSTDKGSFRVAYDRMDHKGNIPNSDLRRNSISSSFNFDINKKLKLSSNLNFLKSASDNRPSTANRGANPLEAVYQWSNVDIRDLKDYWVSGGEGIRQNSPHTNNDNPYFLAYGVNNSYERDHAYGNIKLDYQILPSLSAYVRFTHDVFQEQQETKIPWSYTRVRQGAYYLDNFMNQESNQEFLATYRKKINDFDFVVSAGANNMVRRNTSTNNGGSPLQFPGVYRISNVPIAARGSANYSSMKRIQSVMGMANVGYKDQLYLDVTARNDWSSTLPVDNRSYFYSSVGLSWVASHTFKLPSEISLLKFRANYGQTGNDTGPYQLAPGLNIGAWGDLVTNTLPSVQFNQALKPEIQTAKEVGLDFNLFKNRIRFEGSFFHIENKNQILDIIAAPSTGYSAAKINAGMLASKGIEINLGGTPIRDLNGWTLDINTNFTRTRTRIMELTPGRDYYTLWDDNGGGAFTWVGEEIGNLYSRGYKQVEDPNSEYYKWPILDQNGEWQADNAFDKREKVGNFNPNFIVGGQINLSYKRFNLSASFDWRSGGDFQSYTYRYGESDWKSQRQLDNLIPGGLYSSSELVELLKSDPEKYVIPRNGNFPRVGGHTKETGGMLTAEGLYDGAFIPGVIQNPDGSFTPHLGGAGTNVYPVTDTYPWSYNKQITFDGSFIKLRELSLGYSLKKLGPLSNVNLSVYTRNIMVWTAAKIGIDPERAFQNNSGQFRQGIELQNVYPWTIPFGFKVSLSL
jgi:TonB-linked SusC/RagA family outer membrane protein